ncbi:hypothetical protein KBC25_01830 [Candidatus Pacearchaeota archaeon]|jgi:tetratricopeptide (TPR) repeat protein|nr:hypothetical protein [Candidatus Pacearchaeota archaeon]
MEERGNSGGMSKEDISKKLEKFQTTSEKIEFLQYIEPKINSTNPNTQKAYYETLGDLFLKKENFQEAAGYYKKAGLDEKAEKIWEKLGDIAKTYHEDDKAIEYYKKSNSSEKEEELLKKKETHSLEDKFLVMLAFCTFLFSFVFFSGRITGNTIAQFPLSSHNLIGIGLFIMGMIVTFLYSERKNKNN